MKRLHTARNAVLLGLLAFSPVFLGGIGRFDREWSGKTLGPVESFLWALGPWHVQLALGLILGVLLAWTRTRPTGRSVDQVERVFLGAYIAVAALVLLQMLPMPRAVLSLLSPHAASELEWLLPRDGSWRPLSISPEGSRSALLGLLLGLMAFAASRRLCDSTRGAVLLAATLVGVYAACALYGLWSTYLGDDSVLVLRRDGRPGVTGFFFNRSHMAAAAGLTLPLAISLAEWGWKRRATGGRAAVLAAWCGPVAAIVLLVTIPLTGSRMGLVAGGGGLVVLALLRAMGSRWSAVARYGMVTAAAGAVVVGAVVVVRQLPALQERFAMGTAGQGFFDIRFPAWQSTLQLANRYPVFGTGMGTFEVAIHETQSADNPRELVHAHSEPLELLSDGGLVGLALGMVLAFAVLRAALAAAGSPDPVRRILGSGAAAGLASLAAGCLTEFHLHIPSLGLAALATAAIVFAAAPSGGSREGEGDESRAPSTRVVAVGLALLIAGGGWIVHRHGVERLHGQIVRAQRGGDGEGWLVASKRLVDLGGGGAFALRSLSRATVNLAPDDREGRSSVATEALQQARRAVDLEPFDAWNHWAEAQACLALEDWPSATAAMRRALSRGGGIGHLHFRAGEILLHLSRLDDDLLGEALEALRYAGRVSPGNYTRARSLVTDLGLDETVGGEIVPERPWALLMWAESCRRAEKWGEAEGFARRAMEASSLASVTTKAERILDAVRQAREEEPR